MGEVLHGSATTTEAIRRAMRPFFMNAIQQHLGRRSASRSHRDEDALPRAFRVPANEPIVERLRRAVGRRCVLPAAAGLKDLNNATDNPAVIGPRDTSCVDRQIRLKSLELCLGQPEQFRHRFAPHCWGLEFQPSARGNHTYGSWP